MRNVVVVVKTSPRTRLSLTAARRSGAEERGRGAGSRSGAEERARLRTRSRSRTSAATKDVSEASHGIVYARLATRYVANKSRQQRLVEVGHVCTERTRGSRGTFREGRPRTDEPSRALSPLIRQIDARPGKAT
jgi:hypothetical protein